jgi:CO/xanthine dehydrogenase FAD-binding subunit
VPGPKPISLQDALQILRVSDAAILAGGTDFYPALQDGPAPEAILDTSRIDGFCGIRRVKDIWRIGAATTWTDLIRADLPPVFDGLKAAGRTVGSVQIQNAATLVGNICNTSPAADGVPPLLALAAQVEIAGPTGTRVLDLQDFILGVRKTALAPGELVTALLIPDHPAGSEGHFFKLGSRSYLVISIAMVAVTLVPGADGCIAQARVAVGACSPVALRLQKLESDLVGRNLDDLDSVSVVQATHLEPLTPIDDVRASASYRLTAVLEILQRLLGEAVHSVKGN